MDNIFLQNLEQTCSQTYTENGAIAVNSTGSALLDLFSVAGALRNRINDVEEKFLKAYKENPELATKLAFYTRDIRGGLGERTVGRYMLFLLAKENPEVIRENIALIPFYGRYDDLFILFNTPCENDMISYVRDILVQDWTNMKEEKPVSLLAKWMPSINASSEDTKAYARRFIKAFNTSPEIYRKLLTKLRKYLKVTEGLMSKKEWDKIQYAQVPSYAMNRYGNAFFRNDEDRFSAYLRDVKAGKEEIKASTLYPYDIIEKYMNRVSNTVYLREENAVLEEQWKALPNYIEGENNYLVMADLSGSMYGRPMGTSIGLAIYFAERNKGAFSNKFLTFSSIPRLVNIQGENLLEKFQNLYKKDNVGYDTNIEKAFDAVLEAAIRTHCASEELPKAIIIISDMEFNDYSIGGSDLNFYESMKSKFELAGYRMPKLVFWNVNSHKDTYHTFSNAKDCVLFSGQSISTFKFLMGSLDMTPYEMMEKVLNSDRYNLIKF